jgi:hypothetical protein
MRPRVLLFAPPRQLKRSVPSRDGSDKASNDRGPCRAQEFRARFDGYAFCGHLRALRRWKIRHWSHCLPARRSLVGTCHGGLDVNNDHRDNFVTLQSHVAGKDVCWRRDVFLGGRLGSIVNRLASMRSIHGIAVSPSGTEQIVGPERRERVSHQTWCGERWMKSRRPVNSNVRRLLSSGNCGEPINSSPNFTHA